MVHSKVELKRLITVISYQLLSIVIMLIGLGVVVIAFTGSPLQFQIALGLVGLGFIVLALMLLKQHQERRLSEDKMDVMIAKLDQILQEVKKEDQSKGTGVIIADVLSSGLKYYSEHVARQKREEDS